MAQPTRLKPWLLRPHDEALGLDTHAFLDWVQTTLNVLVGQQVPPSTGFRSLSPGVVDPTTGGLAASGGRVTSLTTKFSASAPSTTSIQLFWDGTNSSDPLRIYRDDGTVAGPFPSNQLVTGLTAATLYFFYPYFDEASQRVLFVSQAGATGSPPIAYTSQNVLQSQAQMLRGRIPLGANLSVTGFSTPSAGSTAAASVGGGGGGGGGHFAQKL